MTRSELAAVLTVAANLDRRMVQPGADPAGFDVTVREWAELVGDLDARDAVTAVREHYRVAFHSLLPADLIRGVTALRRARLDGVDDVDLMADVDPDSPEYPAVLRARRDDVASGRVAREAVQARDARRALGAAATPISGRACHADKSGYKVAVVEPERRPAPLPVPGGRNP